MTAEVHIKSSIRPRQVFCVIEHAYRNRAVAEKVCAGRFTHIGITLELGVEPNWLAEDLATDDEWRIEWSKFYYGLNLAQAFSTDTVAFCQPAQQLELGPFFCRASAAWLRQSAGHAILSACNVGELAWASSGKEPLLESPGLIRWMTWDEHRGITLDAGREL